MKRKYPHLCSPIQIGSLTYRNRMASSPLATPFITREGYMTWEGAAFYEERAKGGAASVTVTEGVTHPETGQNYRRQLTLTDEDCLGMLAVAATSIKRHGAIAALELSHGGKYIDIDIQQGYKSKSVIRYGPSDEEVSEQDGVLVREMPKKILREVVKSFAVGADFARRAGFDLIVLHGGHGWLINQFLSPAVNRRTDEYGGSIANRARLALEILDSIRSVVGSRIPIEFRLSAEEFVEGGYELGEAIEIAKLLEPKIDLLHVSAGSHESAFARTHLPVYARRGELVHYAAELKKHVRVPVAAIGALNDPEEMERIIAEGKADIVVMGRALIADPQLPNKVIQGRDDEIIKCIRCFDCMAERIAKRTRSCAVNPIIGRELEPRESVSRNPRKVLVVGGGPAGMQAAVTAARCGHRVILCEKKSELGGALLCGRAIPFKQDFVDLAKAKAREAEKAGVEVRLNTEVTKEYAEREQADVILVAAGAQPVVPEIPGARSKNVVLGYDISNESVIGQKVVVLGGGLIGTDLAIYCAEEGRIVTLVERSGEIARDANIIQRPIMLREIAKRGVTVKTNTVGLAITERGLICAGEDGKEQLIEADTVIIAVGQKPLAETAETLQDCVPIVLPIGDCVAAGDVHAAILRGYHAGLNIG